MQNEQTAIEWLVEKLQESGISFLTDELEMIEQAKDIERRQKNRACAEAYEEGYEDGRR